MVVERVTAAFRARFGAEPEVVSRAPGRINIIGEHTDYNDGLAMPAAIDRWAVVALGRGDGPAIAMDGGGDAYVHGAMAVTGVGGGFHAVYGGNVPVGAGLSSSAALSVAWLGALRAGMPRDDLAICRLAQRIEHEHAGVRCGLLDPFASVMSRAGHLLVVDFHDLSTRYVPASAPGLCWVALHTGVSRALAGSAYETRVRECDAEYASLGTSTRRGLLTPEQVARTRRLRHVVSENARVRAAAAAAEAGDWASVGRLMVASHESLRDVYEVSCAELDAMVEHALARPSCLGARMMGGGFGGCALALVQASDEDFVPSVLAAYRGRIDLPARGWRFELVGGAEVS